MQKPLRRIEIEEIGLKDGMRIERKAAIAKTEASQSKVKKETEAKDQQMFEKFTMKASGDSVGKVTEVLGDNQSNKDTKTDSRIETISEVQNCKENDTKSKSVDSNAKRKDDNRASNTDTNKGSNPVSANKGSNESLTSKTPSSPRESSSALEREPPQTSYQFQGAQKSFGW